MRSSRSFVAFGQLALLTLALVSCGGQMVPQAPSGQTPSGQSAPQAAGQISTLKVRSGTTEADLLSRYPGSKVLALHADEGYALLYSAAKLTEKQSLGTLSMNAQALTVTTTEPDLTLSTSVTDPAAEAQGLTAWAGGLTAWAGGLTAWAGGVNSGGSMNALADNATNDGDSRHADDVPNSNEQRAIVGAVGRIERGPDSAREQTGSGSCGARAIRRA